MTRSASRSRGYVTAATFTAKPSITGTPQVGQTLTGASGTIVGSTAASRQWIRGVSPIPGATAPTYVVQAADVGHRLSFVVTTASKVTVASDKTALVIV